MNNPKEWKLSHGVRKSAYSLQAERNDSKLSDGIRKSTLLRRNNEQPRRNDDKLERALGHLAPEEGSEK